MDTNLLYILAAIIVLGSAAQWMSWRLNVPSILALLVIGILAGPVSGLLRPDAIFGELLFPIISLGVAVVLFEGGLTLKFSDLRGHGAAVFNLVSWGALLNWFLIAAGCWLLAGLPGEMALLFAAMMVVTGPTVVNPLLRTMRAAPEVSHILRWEGILIDPVGALLALVVYQFIIAGHASYQVAFMGLGAGLLVGALSALLLAIFLRRHWIPHYLINVVTLSMVVLAFAASDYLAHESGLLAVTVMGIWLANSRGLDLGELLSFKESLSILIISALFIVLGARLNPADIVATGWQGVVLLLVVLLARPVVVWASMLGGGYSWQQKALVSWVGPRGIVAAAVSSIFAQRLVDEGYSEAYLLVPYAFLVIISTVLLQSFTARPVARLLGLMEEEPRGILIIGANPVARTIGKALLSHGYRVMLTDTTWSELQIARMDGMDTYYGNAVSAHADQNLNLAGFGLLFAMSRRPAMNTLACLRYRVEFSKRRVFTLRSSVEKDELDKHRNADSFQAPRLFGEAETLQKLSSLVAKGAQVKETLLSEEFGMDDYLQANEKNIVLLFGIDPKDRLRAFTDSYQPPVQAGWTILSLVPAAEQQDNAPAD